MKRVKAPAAAVVLARRFNGRDRYRRKRDRKIAVDWIGSIWKMYATGGCTILRLIEYDPRSHMVKFIDPWTNVDSMDTDRFWKLMRSGTLVKD